MDKTLVIIIGPHAVGKMTVGQELEKITGLKLFHNHMSIELARKLFEFSDPEYKILNQTIIKKRFLQHRSIPNIPGHNHTCVFHYKVYLLAQ